MNYFDVAQSFIEQCKAGAAIDRLTTGFQQALETLGFRYFACCSHVDPLNPPPRAVVLHNYPREWERIFSERELCTVDPVFQRASRTLLPFFWNSDGFRAGLTELQRDLLREAARLGIADGYTIPIHAPSSPGDVRASCSVVPDAHAIDSHIYHAVQLMAFHIYEAASGGGEAAEPAQRPGLSRRERQCLELAAQGKSDWVVGKILGISERTVHNHIESAKRRLRVTTRVQAIVQALASQQIALGDVIKAERIECSRDLLPRGARRGASKSPVTFAGRTPS